MTMYYGTITALQDIAFSQSRDHTIWDEVPYGYDLLERAWSARSEMGVDMVEMREFLPEVPSALWDQMRWRGMNSRLRKVPGHIGRFNLGGIELRLFRFPSAASPFCNENRLSEPLTPRDFELTIRFNPTTLVQGHNVWGFDGSTVLRALVKARDRLQTLGLNLDLLQLPLTEIHLTRDIVFHADSKSTEDESQVEWVAVNQAIRVMEWGKPPYAREFQNYANDSLSSSSSGRRRNIGLMRGSRRSKWVVYDKFQELKDKRKPQPSMKGRPLRVEWRVQRAAQIEKRLQIRNLQDLILKFDCESNPQSAQIRFYIESSEENGFAHLLEAMDNYRDPEPHRFLYSDFDVAFVETFFASEKAYGKRMPVLSPIFVEAVTRYFVSDIQRACLGRLMAGQPITRPDADILIVVLNGIGAARTRSMLRTAFELNSTREDQVDDLEKKRRRREYNSCIKMLFRLRAGARYNARDTWSGLHHWMLWEWGAYLFTEGGFSDTVRCDSEVLSELEFTELAAPLLEQLVNYPHAEDAQIWANSCEFTLLSDGKTYSIPGDLLSIYRQMLKLEQVTTENSRVKYADEQKATISRARELHILSLFPRTKRRASRLKIAQWSPIERNFSEWEKLESRGSESTDISSIEGDDT